MALMASLSMSNLRTLIRCGCDTSVISFTALALITSPILQDEALEEAPGSSDLLQLMQVYAVQRYLVPLIQVHPVYTEVFGPK